MIRSLQRNAFTNIRYLVWIGKYKNFHENLQV